MSGSDSPSDPNRVGKKRATAELEDLFDELDQLLKNPDVGTELADLGVNTSLAMTLAYGLRAYLQGDKEKALLELGTATEEIATRMARKPETPPS
ncbi:MAG TPA: hypothetical protein VMI75_14695 [Polyangiaceae bacterium]|nr:hypothetical protein [Polyangiaceae bacterium]